MKSMNHSERSEQQKKVWEEFAVDRTNINFRNELIELYLPIVKHNARRMKNRLPESVEFDDLVNYGVLGLIDAIAAFDLSRGVEFKTYCVPRIRGAMLDGLREMDWVPRLTRSKSTKFKRKLELLVAKLGRQPSQEEMAWCLGVDLDRCFNIERDATPVNVTSLQEERGNDATNDFKLMYRGDLLEDLNADDPTKGVQKDDFLKLVTKGLNPNEKIIVFLYYYCGQTMKQVGRQLGLSESRVSQMHSDIICRIGKKLLGRKDELVELATAA